MLYLISNDADSGPGAVPRGAGQKKGTKVGAGQKNGTKLGAERSGAYLQ